MENLVAQLTDPFRIGLLVFMLLTARNTAMQVGLLVPVLAGIVFVAILIPTAFHAGDEDWWLLVGLGLVANCIIVAVLLALGWVYDRLVGGAKGRG